MKTIINKTNLDQLKELISLVIESKIKFSVDEEKIFWKNINKEYEYAFNIVLREVEAGKAETPSRFVTILCYNLSIAPSIGGIDKALSVFVDNAIEGDTSSLLNNLSSIFNKVKNIDKDILRVSRGCQDAIVFWMKSLDIIPPFDEFFEKIIMDDLIPYIADCPTILSCNPSA